MSASFSFVFARRRSWLKGALAAASVPALIMAYGARADAPAGAAPAATEGAITEVVVTGVRGKPRAIASSPVPIDIVSAAQITSNGKAGLKDILSTIIPSLTLAAQNGGGTSASVRPYAVEGLTGDYVLVLVNGKRRHNSAAINNLATVGGGSTPVDFDLIPPGAIDHIEYLRAGAAAQYGSDAITGVINIILKDDADGGTSDTEIGQTYRSTGQLGKEDLDWGAHLLGGKAHFAVSALHNAPAAVNDPSGGLLYPLVNGAADPREATGNTNYGSAYGRSTLSDGVDTSYNFTTALNDNLQFYSFSTLSYRNIKDARGAFRPDDLSSLPQIFPNGFQAYRLIHEDDYQAAIGLKGQTAGWHWDLSTSYGEDHLSLGASNTLNASLGPTVTQTRFYIGKQVFDQWVTNLDVTRDFDIGLAKPLDVSWGVEQRWERFIQGAGEANSYINGGYVVPNDGTPFGNLYHGKYPQAGLQSFTGTSPSDAGNHSRNNTAAYVDLGTNLTQPWYVGIAARAEHYDDSSGDSVAGKFTTRYEILPGLAVRASVNNGFHAPSLAEQWFSTTQNTTVVVNGQGVSAQSKFLPADSAIAKALGATPLRPETSRNYTAGITWEPTHRLRVTIDGYETDLYDRIVKSAPNFSLTADQVAALGFPGLSSAQFFTNGVDSRTDGVDVVSEYQTFLGDRWGSLNLSAVYSANDTVITKVRANAANFTPLAARQLTDQTPRYRLALGADWSKGPWKVHWLETLYGPYHEPVNNTLDEVFHPKWVADLNVTYAITQKVSVSVGADNIFNVYPTRVPNDVLLKTAAVDSVLVGAPGYSAATYGVPTSGSGVYGTVAPFGLLGGFYYTRLNIKF